MPNDSASEARLRAALKNAIAPMLGTERAERLTVAPNERDAIIAAAVTVLVTLVGKLGGAC